MAAAQLTQQQVALLKWRARHEPAVWELTRRAARVAMSAGGQTQPPEEAVDRAAEDLIARADTEPAVLWLPQQQRPSGGAPRAQHPAADVAAQRHADVVAAACLIRDDESTISCETDDPIPIIPIRCSLKKPPPAPAPAPAAGQAASTAEAPAAEAGGEEAAAASGGEVDGGRLKQIMDRYRASVAERCRIAAELCGDTLRRDAPQLPPPPPPITSSKATKLALLRAAHDAGALTQQAFQDAVAALDLTESPVNLVSPAPPVPQPLSLSPAPPLPQPLGLSAAAGFVAHPSTASSLPSSAAPSWRASQLRSAMAMSPVSIASLRSQRSGLVSPGRPRALTADASPRSGGAAMRSHSARVSAAHRQQRRNCMTPRPERPSAAAARQVCSPPEGLLDADKEL
eukprot:TRINITY_DN4153_c2_g1_i1.p1 TRINITY_DN4153_c2_g1~~TRINITY_DN4153_c2_g1_i1.p1  ORF type:complete len:416 (+),score=147.48 TRINITY_DN4153_c2_g1_i1:50-1249(+)